MRLLLSLAANSSIILSSGISLATSFSIDNIDSIGVGTRGARGALAPFKLTKGGLSPLSIVA